MVSDAYITVHVALMLGDKDVMLGVAVTMHATVRAPDAPSRTRRPVSASSRVSDTATLRVSPCA